MPDSASSIVIFDLGGILIDWNPRHLYRRLISDADTLETFLANVTTSEWHGGQDKGGDPAAATRALKQRFPEHGALIDAWYGRFDEMCAVAFPEMAALVERLAAAGVPLYLLSNAPAFMDTWMRPGGRLHTRHPFLRHFRDLVVSGAVGCWKPDAAIYRLACTAAGTAADRAVFIDDSAANAAGARATGLHGIHHRDAATTIAELRALGLPA